MIVTIIPAKPFAESKKRLAPVLSHRERILLSQSLLQHTILTAMPLGPVVVVSRSANVLNFSVEVGANALAEENLDLNDAIGQGIEWAQTWGAVTAMVLPLDLPLLTTSVLEKLVMPGDHASPAIVIAPCRHGQGTNALVLTPPDLISPQFGPHSFVRHKEYARTAGVNPTIYHAPQLAFDLDTPQDWSEFIATESEEKLSLEASQMVQTLKF